MVLVWVPIVMISRLNQFFLLKEYRLRLFLILLVYFDNRLLQGTFALFIR